MSGASSVATEILTGCVKWYDGAKGYGFVEMARIDEAKRAVEVLHDQPFMGRTLIVNGAKSKGAVDADGDPAPQENPPPNLPENEE